MLSMKRNLFKLFSVLVCGVVLQGCIALPPIVNVERKESNNTACDNRLEEIERRLDRIEQKLDKR